MKRRPNSERGRGVEVALFTRAWIETPRTSTAKPASMSPSSRGRGLKQRNTVGHNPRGWSPSSRGRGLKLLRGEGALIGQQVALFTRAWIETTRQRTPALSTCASPSSRGRGLKQPRCVIRKARTASPSSRGRGLKRMKSLEFQAEIWSPSSRGRGLKRHAADRAAGVPRSPSSRGRGLKHESPLVAPGRASRPLHEGVD